MVSTPEIMSADELRGVGWSCSPFNKMLVPTPRSSLPQVCSRQMILTAFGGLRLQARGGCFFAGAHQGQLVAFGVPTGGFVFSVETLASAKGCFREVCVE
jgi:hypothetical protein